jgi:hypothetical protein
MEVTGSSWRPQATFIGSSYDSDETRHYTHISKISSTRTEIRLAPTVPHCSTVPLYLKITSISDYIQSNDGMTANLKIIGS